MEAAKIQTFLDGTCDVYAQDENADTLLVRQHVPYELRTVGSKRFFEAAQIGHTISRVIRIPDIGMAASLSDTFIPLVIIGQYAWHL